MPPSRKTPTRVVPHSDMYDDDKGYRWKRRQLRCVVLALAVTSVYAAVLLFRTALDTRASSPVRGSTTLQWIATSAVSDPDVERCLLTHDNSVFHGSLKIGPDQTEIDGRQHAKQPRDFEDTWATVDSQRNYYHPDRVAVSKLDKLGAGIDNEFDDAVLIASNAVEAEVGAVAVKSQVPVAHMRTTRRYGSQTVLNLAMHFNDSAKAGVERRIVTVSRPYNTPCEVNVLKPRDIVTLHIIVSYSGRPARLAAFLEMFAKYLAKTRMLKIIIAVPEAEAEEVRNAAAKHQELTADALKVLSPKGDANGKFSRAVALRDATKLVPKDEVIFFADVDLVLGGYILHSCRMNSVRGSQMWFPIMYSLYPYGRSLSGRDGLWRRSSYGMACMYRQDFDAVGGFGGDEETKYSSWGGEDVDFYNNVRDNRNYAVFRSLEPGLLHKWHGKSCERNEHYASCMRTVYMTVGSQERLAALLGEKEVDISELTAQAAPV